MISKLWYILTRRYSSDGKKKKKKTKAAWLNLTNVKMGDRTHSTILKYDSKWAESSGGREKAWGGGAVNIGSCSLCENWESLYSCFVHFCILYFNTNMLEKNPFLSIRYRQDTEEQKEERK